MTRTWANGNIAAAADLDRWEQGPAVVMDRSQHAPGLNMWFPEAEGALADGTHDDAAAINAAIVKASAAGSGARVVLAAGRTYALGARLSIKANTRMEGDATLKLLGSVTTQALLAQNVSLVRLQDFTIDLNKADPVTNPTGTTNQNSTSNQQGILISATTVPMFGIRISNVTVKNGWQRGIAAVSINSSFSISDLSIDDCMVSTVGDVGIFVSCIGNADRVTPSTSQRIKVRGNQISGDGQGGIQLIGVSYATVSGNNLDGTGSTGHGICFSTAGTTGQVTDFDCTGNKVKNYTGAGKWGIVASNNCKRFTIAANPAVVGCTGGISIDPEDSANLGVLVDVAASMFANTVTGSLNSHGINARICKNLTISGNSSSGNNGSGIVLSNSYACAVGSNTANSNAAYGIAVSGTNAGTGGHTVGPNTTADNTTGTVHTDATPIANNVIGTVPAAPIMSVVAADVTVNNSTALVDATISIPVEANSRYKIDGLLAFNSDPTADVTFKFFGPSGATMGWTSRGPAGTVTASNGPMIFTYLSLTSSATIGTIPTTQDTAVTPVGLLTTGATAGTLTVSFAQTAAAALNTILRAGSWISALKV